MMPISKPAVSPPRAGDASTILPALCVLALFAAATPAEAVQLVTVQEAALPPDVALPLDKRGSPVRRPTAVVVSPAPNAGVVKSPLALKLKLEAHGGAKINPDSIVLTYKKTPEINITQRITPYVSPDGIEVPDAELPPGAHEFRIRVYDNEGHWSATEFSIQVAQ